VTFGRRHPLFGILHRPPTAPRLLPPIVLASAGTVHRIGPHRLYVTLARRWARLGFHVLRLDLSGIGDSPPADDGVENVTYPRDGLLDLGEALGWLGQVASAERFIVAGLCSGGDFAFQMGLCDPRVAGAVILNPRTFCVNDLAQVETGNPPGVLAAAGRVRGIEGEAAPVPESLRRMVERGVDTFLVVTEKDPGVSYVDERWGSEMRALAGRAGFRREDVPGADHNLTSLWAQETVSNLVTDHLVRRWTT
jgi:dienelactone hydrolase